jgi:hypothetical protein
MNTILVWILFNLSTGQPVPHYQFPTQADCIRAGTVFNRYSKSYTPYHCDSMRVVDPYGTPSGQAPSPQDVQARAARNYSYEQNKINDILSHPPAPQQP